MLLTCFYSYDRHGVTCFSFWLNFLFFMFCFILNFHVFLKWVLFALFIIQLWDAMEYAQCVTVVKDLLHFNIKYEVVSNLSLNNTCSIVTVIFLSFLMSCYFCSFVIKYYCETLTFYLNVHECVSYLCFLKSKELHMFHTYVFSSLWSYFLPWQLKSLLEGHYQFLWGSRAQHCWANWDQEHGFYSVT